MRRDGRGPEGKGPMTGRGWGNCSGGADIEGQEAGSRSLPPFPGRFFGRGGFGPGRGMRMGLGYRHGGNTAGGNSRDFGHGRTPQ